MPIFGLFPPNIERLKDEHDIKGLINALDERKQKRRDVRKAATEALGEIGDVQAVVPLVVAFLDQDYDVRKAAGAALEKIGKPAVKPLISFLESEYKEPVRQNVRDVLAKIGKPAVDPLVSVLSSRDSSVRQGAMDTLVKIGKPAVDPLVGALKSKDSSMRQSAAKTLEQLKWQPSNDAQHLVYLIAYERWREIVKFGARAVEPLLEVPDDQREKALQTLAQIGSSAVKPLMTVLNDQTNPPYYRATAARALGQIGDVGVIEPLAMALKDNYQVVYVAAAEALAQIRDPLVIDPLLDALKSNKSELQEIAARALGQFKDNRIVEPLVATLRTPYGKVHDAAAAALEKIGGPRVMEILAMALMDEWWKVRKKAARLLLALGWQPMDATQQARWAAALEDWDELVRLGPVAVGPLIVTINERWTSDINVQKKAAQTLAGLITHRAMDIAPDDLRATAQVSDVKKSESRSVLVSAADERETVYTTVIVVDNSQIRRLAQQELLRRGLEM